METAPTELRITGLAAGGDGLGHLEDGRVVFVEDGVPGDLVELEDLVLGKRMARARAGRILESSPDRVTPRCAHFGRCGGCRWQHIRYEAQLEAKRRIVGDALERIGGLSLDQPTGIVPSPEPYHYRARARLVEADGAIGYRQRSSHACEPVGECPILLPGAETKLVEWLAARRAPSGEPPPPPTPSRKGQRRREIEWEILSDSEGRAVIHRIGVRPDARVAIRIEVLGESLRATPGSFVQGNALLWDALAAEVRVQALAADPLRPGASPHPLRFVELYAGIGFFTLPLVRAGGQGVVFESGREAVKDLNANLELAGFKDRVEVFAGRVERRGDLPRHFEDAQLLVVDPPRLGLETSVREAIAQAGPARVVYVSCDPATLARDLRELVAGGYRVAHARAFDLFPQTPHVEVVVRLERGA